ncbi:MAG: hypothetical protein CVV64_08195 [Candidatus Wallbacteria bacterium HGW-Wallbacteria-1]|jgi:2',3'-cyclic-nucleotide 2'-phosphodiesterase (5'-nucleotidase family)|uniref:5'-Nucleotidase C-terminal domain-containing protein n=1 Tax=Candidatus Wallbacteria bacterium HGW-Wallbacteria-1 TaxID=2013854 RepID=A0A2N1PR74_9BACT|nr:MAG: hypothetical protein CVV64_08195 [Candidatus Wallbacteria bacterium HGW-Wallbacteria-1]
MTRLPLLISILMLIIIFAGCGSSDDSGSVTLVITGLANGNLIPFKSKSGPLKGQQAGGLAQRNSKIESLIAQGDISQNAVFLDVGDNISGTPEAFYTRGKCIVDLMNHSPITAMLLGNREFDYGQEILKMRSKDSRFLFLASNIRNRNGGVPEYLKANMFKEVDGLKLAVLAITPSNTPEVTNPKNVENLIFLQGAQVLSEAVGNMRSQGADIVMCLSQNNLSKDGFKRISDLCVPGLDLLAVITLDDTELEVTQINETSIIPIYRRNMGSQINIVKVVPKADQNRLRVEMKTVFVDSASSRPRAEQARMVVDITRKIDSIMDEVIGEAQTGLSNDYMNESPIGNLITDVMRETAGCDLAFQNSGGIQSALKAGSVRLRDIFKVLPFDNEVVTMKLKGVAIRSILEHASQRRYGVMQISGGSYTLKPAAESHVLESVSVGGEPLDDEKVYTVATNSFLANCGDGYKGFESAVDPVIMEGLREMLVNSIREKVRFTASVSGRINLIEGSESKIESSGDK